MLVVSSAVTQFAVWFGQWVIANSRTILLWLSSTAIWEEFG